MAVQLNALAHVLYLLDRIADPAERIRAIRAVQEGRRSEDDELVHRLVTAVRALRDSGRTWPEIGAVAGVTAQRAQQLATITRQETTA